MSLKVVPKNRKYIKTIHAKGILKNKIQVIALIVGIIKNDRF